jgi:hypothetical protein
VPTMCVSTTCQPWLWYTVMTTFEVEFVLQGCCRESRFHLHTRTVCNACPFYLCLSHFICTHTRTVCNTFCLCLSHFICAHTHTHTHTHIHTRTVCNTRPFCSCLPHFICTHAHTVCNACLFCLCLLHLTYRSNKQI